MTRKGIQTGTGLFCAKRLLLGPGPWYTKAPPHCSATQPLGHHTQAEAAIELHKFWLLVKVNCSLELKRFLCHLYVPKCEPHINNVLLPCRRLCRRVRTDCASFMNQHNIDWPHQMNCENFPELGDDKTCLDPEAVVTRHKDGPSSRAVSGLSTATIVGIVIATVAVITVVVVVVAVSHDKKRNPNRYRSVLR